MRKNGINIPDPPKPKCGASTVIPTQALEVNGATHAGVVTHVCALDDEHKTLCKCACGAEWKTWK